MKSEKTNVDFNKDDVFFIGMEESGSCPYESITLDNRSDNKVIITPVSDQKGICTSDATPRTFVIKVKKEISNFY